MHKVGMARGDSRLLPARSSDAAGSDPHRSEALAAVTTAVAPSERPRLAVVSLGVPPSPYGQSRVLGHLLDGETPASCLLLSENPPNVDPGRAETAYGTYKKLLARPGGLTSRRPLANFRSINEYGGLALSVIQRAREIAVELRRFKPDVIVGCTAAPTDVPAAALAAVMTQTPFAAYLFDDPVFQWPAGRLRRFAAFCEKLWVPAAKAAIAPNEFMAAEFVKRTGKRTIIIRNPVADEAIGGTLAAAPASTQGNVRIVYTGTVYHAQADAIRNVVHALDLLGGRFVLEIYTSQTEAQVAEHGVAGPHVRIRPFVDQHEAYEVQRHAGILLLPLGFRSGVEDVLRSSAPAKLAEYLASGRPILIHAPADSFVVSHFRRHNAGIVVDAPEPAELVAALGRMAERPNEITSLIDNAAELAEMYRASTARSAFWALLREIATGTR